MVKMCTVLIYLNILIGMSFFGVGRCKKILKNGVFIDENIIFDKIDCHPDYGASQASCLNRKCIWNCSANNPCCYYPNNYNSYEVSYTSSNPYAIICGLKLNKKSGFFPKTIENLLLYIQAIDNNTLNFKITDSENKQFIVPIIKNNKKRVKIIDSNFFTETVKYPFGLRIFRKETMEKIFDTTVGPLIFSDQYIEINTDFSTKYSFGIGQRVGSLRINHNWTTYPLFNDNAAFSETNKNLYGTHPFSLHIEKSKKTFGVLFYNSNAMEIQARPSTGFTYRTIGGILNFYIILGNTPDETVMKYTDLIGKPMLIPRWALGYHLSKYGYKHTVDFFSIIEKMRKNEIPMDVQWTDIDILNNSVDFTINSQFNDIGAIINILHLHNMKFMPTVNPGIPEFDATANVSDIFISYSNSSPIIGKSFAGNVVYLDYTKYKSQEYWLNKLSQYFEILKYDGIWLNMNEASSFVNGSIHSCPYIKDSFDYPPYTPKFNSKHIFDKKLCMSAIVENSLNYNYHNLFSYYQGLATNIAISKILKNRSLIVSRSTFVGSGKYVGNWQGDNFSKWKSMYFSIPAMLMFNMFGISFVGSDVCGYFLDADEELCTRWTQMAAFTPFMRNNNHRNFTRQDPFAFSEKHTAAVKYAIRTRYKLIPHLYSLYCRVVYNETGTFARPMFFNFPADANTYDIDDQFMLEESILVIPVLNKNQTSIDGYLTQGIWYSLDGKKIYKISKSGYYKLDVNYNSIPVLLRENSIIPTQVPDLTTYDSDKSPLSLIVTLSEKDANAKYILYVDDGVSLPHSYSKILFTLKNNVLSSEVLNNTYKSTRKLENILIYGFMAPPNNISSVPELMKSNYDSKTKILSISYSHYEIMEPLRLTFT